MAYEAVCPKGHRLQVTDSHFGERVACPTCGEQFVVPVLKEMGRSVAPPPLNTAEPGTRGDRLTSRLMGTDSWLAIGRPMLMIGLAMALLARGCDAVGRRAVTRAESKLVLAKARVADDWQQQRRDVQKEIKEIENKTNRTPADFDQVTSLNKRLTEIDENQRKAREAFEANELPQLEADARDASAVNQSNAFWREAFFVLASIVLAVGLLIVSWNAQGAERWISLVMLAIITFSLYVAGTAWSPFPV